ncbi:MAG: YqgE/AlgH family protein, partial [Gemmatimonadaceae bacterium]
GVMINHPTKFSLASVLPDPKVLHGRPDLLYVGGPVALDSLTMLIRTPRALPSSVRVLDGVYASESVTTLRAAVDAKLATSKFRAYAGYAGWAPGQLDAELEQGAWTVVPANAAEVFTTAPDDLWEKLSQSGSTMLVRLDGCRRTIHPSCAAQVVRAVAALD